MTENKQQLNLPQKYTELSTKYNQVITVSTDKSNGGKGTQKLNDILAVVIKKDTINHTNIF